METGFMIIAEFKGCNPEKIKKIRDIKPVLEKAVKESGLKKLCSKYHQFKPFGVTGFILLAESHLSVHTWPEKGTVAIDIFTCNSRKKAEKAFVLLKKGFKPEKIERKEFAP
ncbi:MAG: adenosylmethionine decarboxylase [Candidatus Diapherotrites archaeon]